MRKIPDWWRWLLAIIVLWGWSLISQASAQGGPPAGAEFAPGEVLVQWHEGAYVADSLLARVGAARIDRIEALRVDRLRVPVGRELEVIARLQADPQVVYAEPNYLARAAYLPNDPSFGLQWNLSQILAPQAWDVIADASGVRVAVIDSGADLDHPDLGIRSRLEYGFDYVRSDTIPDDEAGHGTHVLGILSALTDNAMGVAGLAWNVRLLLYKVLDANEVGTSANVAAAIVSASAPEKGTRIINLSLTLSGPSQTVANAVSSAANAGILLVAAAGNGNSSVAYPAAYPQVLAVAATTSQDRRAWYSNRGPEIDVAAPGGLAEGQIYSTLPRSKGSYGYKYGTSMAAPHVSALAALIWSLRPDLSRDRVRQIILDTADKVDSATYPYVNGRNDYLGYGRINAHLALRRALPPTLTASPPQLDVVLPAAQPTVTRSVLLTNQSLQKEMSWRAWVAAGGAWLSLNSPTSGSLLYPSQVPLILVINAMGWPPGMYTGIVRVEGSYRDDDNNVVVQQLDIRVQLLLYSHRVMVPLVAQ